MKTATMKGKSPQSAPVSVRPPELDALLGETSLGQLSRATGIHRTHLSRIFSGQRTPSMKMAGVICEALGVSMDKLHEAVQTGKVEAA